MSNTYLENLLGEHEEILLVTRQHWFLLASAIAVEVGLLLALFILTAVGVIALPEFRGWVVLAAFLFSLVPIATLTMDVLRWSNHEYVITNRRVMQISGIYNKNVTDSSLEKVNDVKLVQSALGRMFDYGDIEILTASELGVNLFKRIKDPVGFKKTMINAKQNLESGEDLPRGAVQKPVMGNITRLILELDELRKQGILSEEEFQQKKAELLSKL